MEGAATGEVSIPFRGLGGFRPGPVGFTVAGLPWVSIPFRGLGGFRPATASTTTGDAIKGFNPLPGIRGFQTPRRIVALRRLLSCRC